MATTTNYNWATPDDTDLVKDGASAIRTLGSSADTTVKNLNPGTTAGDIDYYTSSTAKARIGIGTAGQVLRVNSGATAPEWATTADQTPLTTKGDLFTFDTADARLGVGANGTVLTADSAETTGLKWAAPASASPANASATVATQQTTTSTTYTDLTTSGPAVTVTTGTKALVIINYFGYNQTNSAYNYTSYAVSGATTIAASDTVAAIFRQPSNTNEQAHRISTASRPTLTAGSNTFTMKYRMSSAVTGYFGDREIIVIDLGS